jgi:hypothetical protein
MTGEPPHFCYKRSSGRVIEHAEDEPLARPRRIL